MFDSTHSRAARIRRDPWRRRHDRSKIRIDRNPLMACQRPTMLPAPLVTPACNHISAEATHDNAANSKLDTAAIMMVFNAKTPVTESWSITIDKPSLEDGARATTVPELVGPSTAGFDKQRHGK